MQSPAYDETALREAIAESMCWNDVLRKFGRRTAGGNHRTVQRYAARWNISTEHFDPHAGRRRASALRMPPLAEVLVEGSTYKRSSLKKRLFDEGLKKRRCEICGQGEVWRGRPMSLILDHINGVSDDNRLENLQIVCPNCNATLDTYCNRNAVPLRPRACLSCGTDFPPRYSQQRYCSQGCAGEANGNRLRDMPKPDQRKVERPPYEQLLRELEETNFSAVGRKYGVSDNAVRKWVRSYERTAA